MEGTLHPVNVGPCRCPGTPHTEGDIVSLDVELSTPAGIAANAVVSLGGRIEDILSGLLDALMRHSIREWTFLDAKGKPVPVNQDNIRAYLPWLKGGKEVSAAAQELYADTILGPFVRAFLRTTNEENPPSQTESSPDGSTEESSTSANPSSLETLQTPSTESSPTSTEFPSEPSSAGPGETSMLSS